MKALVTAALLLALGSPVAASFTITLSTSGPRSPAVVVSSPAGINCGSSSTACVASFAEQSTATLSVIQASTVVFAGWGGEGRCPTNLASCRVPLTSSRTVSAAFNPVLAVSLSGNGAGTVTDSSGSVVCNLVNGCASGAAVTQSFPAGTVVVLRSSAAANSTLTGWSGYGGCGAASTCAVTMDSYHAVIATYTSNGPFTIRVATGGAGAGVIFSSPPGITCGSTHTACSASFSSGTVITFSAAPSTGSYFAGWANGGCGSTGTCVVTSSSARQSLGGAWSPAAFFYRR